MNMNIYVRERPRFFLISVYRYISQISRLGSLWSPSAHFLVLCVCVCARARERVRLHGMCVWCVFVFCSVCLCTRKTSKVD